LAFIQNLFTSRDNNADSANNVGQQGRLCWDPVTNRFYVSDGVTPGGIPVNGGNSGNTNSISNGNTSVAIPAANGNVAVTVSGVANTVVFATGNTVFAGNLLPTANNTYTLGTVDVQWKSLYVSGNTIYIESNALSADGPNLFWNNDQVIAANATGDINVAAISATGNITGNYIFGNGSQLTGLPATYGNANVAAYLPTYTGNLVALTGNITTTANISGSYILGNGSQLTGLPTGGAITVLNQGNVLTTTANSLNFTGSGVSSSATGNSITVDIYGVSNFLPPQAGNVGNVLSTDGTNTLWQNLPGAFGLVIDGGNAVYVSPYIIDGGFAI
jgi:hypothetical protein